RRHLRDCVRALGRIACTDPAVVDQHDAEALREQIWEAAPASAVVREPVHEYEWFAVAAELVRDLHVLRRSDHVPSTPGRIAASILRRPLIRPRTVRPARPPGRKTTI